MKSNPVPALRLIYAPLLVGRAAVPWIVLVPAVILKGSADSIEHGAELKSRAI
jgi:hypothetical protein